MAEPASHRSPGQRLRREVAEYAAVAAYLWVCFAALAFYRSAILEDAGLDGLHYGAAAVKALILGKFMLLGRAAGVGEHVAVRRPLYRIVWRSLATLALLVVLSLLEHALEAVLRSETMDVAIWQMLARRWREIAAACLLLWMILLPWFAYRELAETLGEGELRRRLLTPR